jgi:hypothetical protein
MDRHALNQRLRVARRHLIENKITMPSWHQGPPWPTGIDAPADASDLQLHRWVAMYEKKVIIATTGDTVCSVVLAIAIIAEMCLDGMTPTAESVREKLASVYKSGEVDAHVARVADRIQSPGARASIIAYVQSLAARTPQTDQPS